MGKVTFATACAASVLVSAMVVAVAQTDSPQPSRNDPPPVAPNQTSKDSVPPATDDSLPTRGGKQEPSSKLEGTNPTPSILANGVLTVPGADPNGETAPAKFSARTDEADQLPIAAYALRHLTAEQRSNVFRKLQRQMALSSEQSTLNYAVGSEVPAAVALHDLKLIPAEIVSQAPALEGLSFSRAGGKVFIIDPTLRVVLAVLE